jgi:hypothetical protein
VTRRLNHLWRQEQGQVLYLAVMMVLLLGVLSMILVNVIYVSVMKIKAQNAADNLALSAATLRARAFNQMTDLNMVIEVVGLENGSIHTQPYASQDQARGLGTVVNTCLRAGRKKVDEFNRNLNDFLTRLAHGNGLDEVQTKAKLFPAQLLAWQVNWTYELLKYRESDGSLHPVGWIQPACTALQPNPDYLFVQSRVEWTLGAMIGFKSLGFRLPDLVTRARAQIIPRVFSETLPLSCATSYSVVLARPDDALDEKIKNQDWIQ